MSKTSLTPLSTHPKAKLEFLHSNLKEWSQLWAIGFKGALYYTEHNRGKWDICPQLSLFWAMNEVQDQIV